MTGAFDGQLAVITGATGGVGKAVARALARHGASLCLIGRDEEKLNAVCRELATPDRIPPIAYLADFAQAEDLRRFAPEIAERFTHVHVLAHCAGAITVCDLADSSIDDLDGQYQVNVRAPFLITQAMLPMLKRAAGQVVFVNSTAGLVANARLSQYAATKHALKALADSLREEVNADGVRVLSVFLGRTASAMQQYVHQVEGKPYHPDRLVQPDDVAAMIIHALSLPRTAEVTEIRVRPFLSPRAHATSVRAQP